jgi:hypothetical protein
MANAILMMLRVPSLRGFHDTPNSGSGAQPRASGANPGQIAITPSLTACAPADDRPRPSQCDPGRSPTPSSLIGVSPAENPPSLSRTPRAFPTYSSLLG